MKYLELTGQKSKGKRCMGPQPPIPSENIQILFLKRLTKSQPLQFYSKNKKGHKIFLSSQRSKKITGQEERKGGKSSFHATSPSVFAN